MYFVELVINGIAVGSLYALIALGFVLIYKSTGVINFAQGEAIMVAAFVAYYLATKFGFPFWLVVPVTLFVSCLLGIGTERLIIRPMLGEPVFSVVMVTVGSVTSGAGPSQLSVTCPVALKNPSTAMR